MTEDDAKAWLTALPQKSSEAMERLDQFRAMVIAESANQNLISAATIDHFWARHIVDSAQLLVMLGGAKVDPWLDLGTGAGFPGVVAAILTGKPVTLVESRRRRSDFLAQAADSLGLSAVSVHAGRLETLAMARFAVISARAFAPLPKLLDLAHRFSTNGTVWLLPKGKSAAEELESIRASWQGTFHVKQSITDDNAAIIVARGVKRVGKR